MMSGMRERGWNIEKDSSQCLYATDYLVGFFLPLLRHLSLLQIADQTTVAYRPRITQLVARSLSSEGQDRRIGLESDYYNGV